MKPDTNLHGSDIDSKAVQKAIVKFGTLDFDAVT